MDMGIHDRPGAGYVGVTAFSLDLIQEADFEVKAEQISAERSASSMTARKGNGNSLQLPRYRHGRCLIVTGK